MAAFVKLVKKAHLLMLNNEFPPLGGGTGTVNEQIILQLAQFPDLKIDLVTSALGKSYEELRYLPNVHIYKVPVNNRNIHHSSNRELLAYTFRALLKCIQLNYENPYDFCLAFSTVPAGGVALALRYLIRLPYYVRVCGPDIPGFEQRYALMTRILKVVIQMIWKNSETVIAKCQHEVQMIRKIDPGMSTLIIPNAVDVHRFSPDKKIEQKSEVRILCVARLIQRKGQRYLIQAFHQLINQGLTNIRLVLVGNGDDETELRSLVNVLGISDQVNFIGYVPREEIPSIYAQADIFALPSYNEGMSVATLEAIAAGLPLVVTRDSGLDDLVKQNGYSVSWANVDELAEALGKLVRSPQLRREMGQKSRQQSLSYSWVEIGSNYYQLLKNGITGRNRLVWEMVPSSTCVEGGE